MTLNDPDLAWARGRLVFRDRPLAGILADLAPYHRDRLILLNRDLAKRRFSGTFGAERSVMATVTYRLR